MASNPKLTFPPLISFLKDRRESLNAVFNRHRLRFPRIEDGLGLELITSLLEPAWKAVDGKVSDGLIVHAVWAWYDLGLELAGKGFCPGGHLSGLWPATVRIARAFPGLVVTQARQVLTALANALWQLQQQGPDLGENWLGILETLAGENIDLASWMKAGSVAAWRCGMAHQRKPALEAALKLGPRIGSRCLGLTTEFDIPQWKQLINTLSLDPWYDPETGKSRKESAPSLVRCIGSFRGLGGFFPRPPKAVYWNQVLIAGFDQDWFVVHADLYGSGLQRIKGDSLCSSHPLHELWKIQEGGKITRGSWHSVIPELSEYSSAAANEHFLAVTLTHSHRIFLVA